MRCIGCRARLKTTTVPWTGACLHCGTTNGGFCLECVTRSAKICFACRKTLKVLPNSFGSLPVDLLSQPCSSHEDPTVLSISASWPCPKCGGGKETAQSLLQTKGGKFSLPTGGKSLLLRCSADPFPVRLRAVAEPSTTDICFTAMGSSGGLPCVKIDPAEADLYPDKAGSFAAVAFVDTSGKGDYEPGFEQVAFLIASKAMPTFPSCAPIPNIPSERVVYNSETPTNSGFFYLSNENDWKGLSSGAPKADVVVAFSNNVGWDQAIESQAQLLVLCDWQPEPLIAQELLFRPLILSSESAADFISRVYGEPLPSTVPPEVDISDLFEILKKSRAATTLQERSQFHQQILLAAKNCTEVTTEQLAFLADYYTAIATFRGGNSCEFPLPLNQIGGRFGTSGRDLAEEFFLDFEARYRKKVSCLSSATSFGQLKELFKSGVYYARGDIRDLKMFQYLANAFCCSRWTLNVSNVFGAIWDFAGKRSELQSTYGKDLDRFHAASIAALLTALNSVPGISGHVPDSFQVIVTKGVSGLHSFTSIQVDALLEQTQMSKLIFKALEES